MSKLIICVLMFLLSSPAFAQLELNIAGQEGSERFFPLLQAIYAQLGVQVKFDILPSARALALTNQGIYDAEIGRIEEIGEVYPNLKYSSEPLLTVRLVALVDRGSKIRLTSADELKHYRVGYLIGMSVAEVYVKQAELKAMSVVSHEQLAKMLGANRLDVVLMGTAFADSPLYQIGAESLTIATFNVYHILNKKYAYLLPEFDQILRQKKENGLYEQLLFSVP